MRNRVEVGLKAITIEDIERISKGESNVVLSKDKSFVDLIQSGADALDMLLDEGHVIYGVTTGYGDSVTRHVKPELIKDLPVFLSRFHGCGLGAHFSASECRAILMVRLSSLTTGFSAVSINLLEALTHLIQQDILPLIPEEGSVGASGDLTPLSYVVAALIGERKVQYQENIYEAQDLFDQLDIKAYQLRPKEALAIMNGTAVMSAIACLNYKKAERLMHLCNYLTAMASHAILGNPHHFDEILFRAKPHPGQMDCAQKIRSYLGQRMQAAINGRLQDQYSIRCAPHIVGILGDALPHWRQMIETEINSANDNPLIDVEQHKIYHGGHFYGGHIAYSMDGMKLSVANLADLMDRQMALLVDAKFNRGLSSNLASSGENASISHGLKAVQIGASAWTAEALKQTMPASVFSRSTECHNQDKVSMGTIAARDCRRVLTLTAQVAAAHSLAVIQALRLRLADDRTFMDELSNEAQIIFHQLNEIIPGLEEDKPLEKTLRHLTDLFLNQDITKV